MTWLLESLTSQLFVQQLTWANTKINTIIPHYWPFVRGKISGFPSQRASNVETVSISWHHHEHNFGQNCSNSIANALSHHYKNTNWMNKTTYLHKFIFMNPVEFLRHDISESYHNSTRCHIVINPLDLKFYDAVRHKLPIRHAHVDLVNTNVKGLNGLWMKNYIFMRNVIDKKSLIAVQ